MRDATDLIMEACSTKLMPEIDWEDLLLAYMHDPFDKALRVQGHESRAQTICQRRVGAGGVAQGAPPIGGAARRASRHRRTGAFAHRRGWCARRGPSGRSRAHAPDKRRWC